MQQTITILLVLTCFTCFGQKTEKVIVSTTDPFDLYANFDKDSTTLFYEKLVPVNNPIGVIVILPGSGELIEDVKNQITLHTLAVQNNFLVIFPSINWGTTKHIPQHKLLDTIFKQIVEKHKISKDKFIIGGFSGGGMLALTYTEKANKSKDSTYLVPRAVFGVDPPLDYAHLWKHCENDIQRNVSGAAVYESKWIMDMYTREFGGPPETFKENYIKYSIFSYGQEDGGNAQYLIKTPVLLYTEPDVMWQMQNRQRDYYDMNCVDIAAMINFLQIKGNTNAKLVVTSNKGKRLNGKKHPHSWSIMDSKECLEWILNQLNSK